MTSLGEITLSDHLVLGGIESAPGIVTNERRFISGDLHVHVAPLSGGRPFSLSGENHFTLAQITAVKALEAQGVPVTLVHLRGTYSVLITGVNVEPTFKYVNPDPDDWYSGEITLIEVE